MTSAPERPAYRLFDVQVRAVTVLSPSFLRVTFTGPNLDSFDDVGDDQRLKLVLPRPGARPVELPRDADWYAAWRALPDAVRPALRTYTVAAVRPAAREVDVVFVRHGATGPASAWAEGAAPGDRLTLVGPDARSRAPRRAAEWSPPDAGRLLLAADETAVPAVLAVLAGLAGDRPGVAHLEVPVAADVLPHAAPPGVEAVWHPRDGRPHGSLLCAAVSATVAGWVEGPPGPAVDVPPADDDATLLWDVADAADAPLYVWLAGEAGVVRGLRRHLVGDLGVDRRAVTAMGYWRRGATETD